MSPRLNFDRSELPLGHHDPMEYPGGATSGLLRVRSHWVLIFGDLCSSILMFWTNNLGEPEPLTVSMKVRGHA